MHIVLFTHPFFLGSQSMPRFAAMLADGMRSRGHSVKVLSPKSGFFNLPVPLSLKKWFGYIDQYVVFPWQVRKFIKSFPEDTLFVFADQALGPWVPIVADRPHVIHCHDFLAQKSALDLIEENKTGWTGVIYQKYIKNGYLKGKNFISVSSNTRKDLHQFYPSGYQISEVVYNGLSESFVPQNLKEARTLMSDFTGIDCRKGYILHVGGNQWYKNRIGLVQIYSAWRNRFDGDLPLLLIGAKPSPGLLEAQNSSPYRRDIHFLIGIEDEKVRLAYAGASVFFFPSLAEGFGWPIAEAMASGAPVITTNAAPMTEVAGDAAVFIPKKPADQDLLTEWINTAADKLEDVLFMPDNERHKLVQAGIKNSERFNSGAALDQIEIIYKKILYKRL